MTTTIGRLFDIMKENYEAPPEEFLLPRYMVEDYNKLMGKIMAPKLERIVAGVNNDKEY